MEKFTEWLKENNLQDFYIDGWFNLDIDGWFNLDNVEKLENFWQRQNQDLLIRDPYFFVIYCFCSNPLRSHLTTSDHSPLIFPSLAGFLPFLISLFSSCSIFIRTYQLVEDCNYG
jgi:hypothetical protein